MENLHTLVRSVNPCPTALLYKRVIKGIGISQFLGSGVRKGSYGQDTSTEQLIDFDHVKALCLEKKEESKEDAREDNSLIRFASASVKEIFTSGPSKRVLLISSVRLTDFEPASEAFLCDCSVISDTLSELTSRVLENESCSKP